MTWVNFHCSWKQTLLEERGQLLGKLWQMNLLGGKKNLSHSKSKGSRSNCSLAGQGQCRLMFQYWLRTNISWCFSLYEAFSLMLPIGPGINKSPLEHTWYVQLQWDIIGIIFGNPAVYLPPSLFWQLIQAWPVIVPIHLNPWRTNQVLPLGSWYKITCPSHHHPMGGKVGAVED